MKKGGAGIAVIMILCMGFFAEGFAQGKHTSSLDRCVRNCDMSYKNCMSSKKKESRCAEKRRLCRSACVKSHRR